MKNKKTPTLEIILYVLLEYLHLVYVVGIDLRGRSLTEYESPNELLVCPSAECYVGTSSNYCFAIMCYC